MKLQLNSKLDYSATENTLNGEDLAKFGEFDLGLSYRPIHNDKLNLLAVYSYVYDLDPQQNTSDNSLEGSFNDQLAHVFSIDTIYDVTRKWEVGGKVAWKSSQVRNSGADFTDLNTLLYIVRTKYNFWKKWNVFRRMEKSKCRSCSRRT